MEAFQELELLDRVRVEVKQGDGGISRARAPR